MTDGVGGDAETQRMLGALLADMQTVKDRTKTIEEQLKGVVAMTNRWKGATTILIFLGGLIGYITNFLAHRV